MNRPDNALANYYQILNQQQRPRFKQVDLQPKIEEAHKILESCKLCQRKCRANRLKGETGFCQVADQMTVSSYFTHHGEEPFLVPSFTIFFWSCTFSCQYCQNWQISQRYEPGTPLTPKRVAQLIDANAHCKNINLVGGDPVPQLPFILKTLSLVKSNLPVVWNSNFYMSERAMELLRGVVDVYLSDWKYGNDQCARRLSKADHYWETIRRNHLLAFQDSELVIRHLVLPNHLECCTKPVLEFIARNFGNQAMVNLMDQYHPEFKAEQYPDINRRITSQEFSQAVKLAQHLKVNHLT